MAVELNTVIATVVIDSSGPSDDDHGLNHGQDHHAAVTGGSVIVIETETGTGIEEVVTVTVTVIDHDAMHSVVTCHVGNVVVTWEVVVREAENARRQREIDGPSVHHPTVDSF